MDGASGALGKQNRSRDHTPLKSLLRHVDADTVSASAKAETRNREVHLPPVTVYRWWARRTAAVNEALLAAAESELGLDRRLAVADPFVGGGVIPLIALQRGHDVYAQDLNPWATAGLSVMLGLPTAKALKSAGDAFVAAADWLVRQAYATHLSDGTPALISQTLRVAVGTCGSCGSERRLFPHAMVSLRIRKDRGGRDAILACPSGHLFDGDAETPTNCPQCSASVDPAVSYVAKRLSTCPACGHEESLHDLASRPEWRWEVAIVERGAGSRRELAIPTQAEVEQADGPQWQPVRELGKIPSSHEARVLRRHGFDRWEDIYTARQRHLIEALLDLADATPNAAIRRTLRMAVLGTVEMAGLLSRWDRYYLKSYESMAAHRFNFSTLVAEPNVVGAGRAGRGTLVRRLIGMEKAARWLEEQEMSGLFRRPRAAGLSPLPRSRFAIVCGTSSSMRLEDNSIDLVLTDPPYHDDVQYHELSLPLRAWAGHPTDRVEGEAIAIPHSANLQGHVGYRELLIPIFREMRRILKPTGRLIFSYANREPAAWVNLFAALREADFRPVGYTIVHSENETDHSKRNGRACRLDLILELAAADADMCEQWSPEPKFASAEENYLHAVGEAFLASGDLVNGWQLKLVDRLKSEIFVRPNLKESNLGRSAVKAEPGLPLGPEIRSNTERANFNAEPRSSPIPHS